MGEIKDAVVVALSRTYDTWGNYGQHNGVEDDVRIGDVWHACDAIPGAEIRDNSTNSAKNKHTKILVSASLPVGTLCRTTTDYKSSGNASVEVAYWRVVADGSRAELAHTATKRTGDRVCEHYHTLEDGTRMLVNRSPVGVRTNDYPGTCRKCTKRVPAGSGELRRSEKTAKWLTTCLDCFLAEEIA